jgi:hypothetical protein
MRELRGVIIEETEGGSAGTRGAMPVDAARDVLRAAVEQPIQHAIRFNEDAAEAQSNPAETQFNGPTEPDHSVIRITTGTGKSEATRGGAAGRLWRQRNHESRTRQLTTGVK